MDRVPLDQIGALKEKTTLSERESRMPAQDKIHGAVKNALIKDGWTITAEPLALRYEDVMVFADLEAVKTPQGQCRRIIVVEVKSFLSNSPVHELETALGQYQLYRVFLDETRPEHELYLAVDRPIFEKFFQLKGIQLILKRCEIAIIVVDVLNEEIVQWTK